MQNGNYEILGNILQLAAKDLPFNRVFVTLSLSLYGILNYFQIFRDYLKFQ